MKTVTIKIVSTKGHDEVVIGLDAAIALLRTRCEKEGKWGYLDGRQITNFETLTPEMLETAEDITLTNQLAGGEKESLCDMLVLLRY